jgi:hypothetical protein
MTRCGVPQTRTWAEWPILQVHEDGYCIHDQHGYDDQEHEAVVLREHCRITRFVEFAGSQQFLFQRTGNRCTRRLKWAG